MEKLKGVDLLVADINGDGDVTSADALLALKRSVGMLDENYKEK